MSKLRHISVPASPNILKLCDVLLFTDAPDSVCQPRKVFHRSVEVAPNMFDYQGHKFTFDTAIGKYSCAACESKGKRKNDMHCHILRVHLKTTGYNHNPGAPRKVPPSRSKSQPAFLCFYLHRLVKHINIWPIRKIKIWYFVRIPVKAVCEVCGKILSSAGVLKKHVEGVHGMGNSKFDCKDCGKVFKCYGSLYVHRRWVHNASGLRSAAETSTEPIICPSCGKLFQTVWKLKIHENEFHRKGGVYHCHKCPLTFDSRHESSKHYKRAHSNPNYVKKKEALDLNESAGAGEVVDEHLQHSST